ncbi:N-methyl-L-tryptophan oxidase [Enterovirga aerilata]|uniref:N-methyl-L-tryptophan oxidase n=1 Tax=Enterovirga aerilata TaxID=2730920 RepID=A0A849ILK1_9HYPH|nr:N-methyl-L-tryptophan oxidase [Enterovirga sp. DB1703]NNM74833.1 N-methyl-L-tryptophan oxidase [Enterovirga sp. DB1703]
MTVCDVVVIGLGAMGSAAALQLARRGAKVVGIDRFSPPHEHGSSHGETRITREAIGEGEEYVPLAMRAHEIWREIEAATGEELLVRCGGLVLAAAGAVHPAKAAFMDRTIAAAERFAIPHEVLAPDDVRRRFPQFILHVDEQAYFEPGAGFVYPERCIAAQLRLAGQAGATLRTGETVTSIAPSGSGVRVETDRDVYEAARAVLSAGAWSPGLAGTPLAHMTLHRQVLNWFESEDPTVYAPGRFPVFIWLHRGRDAHSYGFPIPPGSEGLKIATENFERRLDAPEEIDRDVTEEEIEQVHAGYVADRFRGVTSRCLRAKTCFYTLAPDSRFAIDDHPENGRLLVVSACSGHGFKHSAAIGEAVAERVLDGRSRLDLSRFALPKRDRAA